MKKIFFLLLMSIMFSCCFGQTKPKPTKQQTMDWIAGKLTAYLNSPREFQSYNNGLFIYRRKDYDENDKYLGISSHLINLNNITSFELSNYFSSTNYNSYIEGKNLIKSIFSYKKDIFYDDNMIITGNSDDSDNPSIFNLGLDATLKERMQKALKLLVEYNTGLENEAF